MNVTQILEDIAGNGILGIVLAWFMLQHGHLVKSLMSIIQDATESIQNSADTMKEVKKVIEKCDRK